MQLVRKLAYAATLIVSIWAAAFFVQHHGGDTGKFFAIAASVMALQLAFAERKD